MAAAMTTDRELLGDFAGTGSEDAFREIVRRHVNLVYSAALRQLCGDAPLAEEVTQTVFTALAARAKSRVQITHLVAWLYTTTRFAVSHAVRAERRRRARELEAHKMNEALADSSPEPLPAIPPALIDEALAGLRDRDREAVMLRFFEGQSFAAIGTAMETGEDAARMRVTRALEKIRATFARRGITSSAAAVGATLASQAIAAPAELAATVSATAMAGPAAAATVAKFGILTFMSTKGTIGLAAAAVILGIGYLGYSHQPKPAARAPAPPDRDPAGEFEPAPGARPNGPYVATAPPPSAAKPIVAAPRPRGLESARRETDAERMARLKPLLEAGMPIKGSVLLLVGGRQVEQQVEFVMGRDTLIDTGNGTVAMSPALNADGSVSYSIGLRGKDWNGSVEAVQRLPTVVNTPWGSFEVFVGDQAIAFDFENNPRSQ
jgi:RNA polymerase sigma factor (sigma-70 family)